MMKFKVPDMTCGHCAKTVEKAVKDADPSAQVSVDLPRKVLTVQTAAGEGRVRDLIRAAGYEIERLPG